MTQSSLTEEICALYEARAIRWRRLAGWFAMIVVLESFAIMVLVASGLVCK